MRRLRSWLWLTVAGALSAAFAVTAAPLPEPPAEAPAAASSQTAPVVPLAPVEVQGKRNLLEEQAARRKRLLDQSAPCLGCDAKPLERKPSLLRRIANSALNQVTPQAPKELNEADRAAVEQAGAEAHPANARP